MHGWMGRRLRVDLTENRIVVEKMSNEYLKKWIGGRGLNSEVLYSETWAGLDPFDPANPLCFGVGPLVGSFAPLSGRTTVSARSPMTCTSRGSNTHAHGDTNMGGHFGPAVKYAGYDQIIVKGKADKPVYLWIDDDKIEIRDASHLWGMKIKEATIRIVNDLGDPDIKVALIGPAGENLVRFSCIINTFSSAAGRTGMGAVMGSKNLKAIAVRGTKPITVAEPEKFAKASWELREKIHNSPSAIRRRDEGSMDLFDVGNIIGINAHKNASTGYMPDIEKTYGGYAWADKYLFRRKACWSCPVGCGRYTYIKEGKYAGFNCGGPEMESVCNLGPRIDSNDVDAVNVMCGMVNELGMDSVSAGAALSWTMECFDKGYLTDKDTGGISFDWGDCETSMKVLEMIASRQGFGDILAEGNIRAAEKMGVGSDVVPHCRGLEHISVDPRITLGFSLGYAMSTRGSDHLKNYSCLEFQGCATSRSDQVSEVLGPELSAEFWNEFPKELYTMKTKPKLCTWSEKNKCVADLVGCCCQAIGSWGGAGTWKEAYAPLLRLITGADLSDDEIFLAAERVVNIERAHWNREGSARQDDTHIDRFFEEGVVDGPYKDFKLNRDEWAWAQSEYYKYHNWDEEGFISADKLRELDLNQVIPDMEAGRILYKMDISKK